jgi:hypothetical protein
MAREGNIENPTKVTLYMPRDTVERGKKFASKTGSSLSQLVTNLVEKEVDDVVPVTVKFSLKGWEDMSAKAEEQNLTLGQYIWDCLVKAHEDTGD